MEPRAPWETGGIRRSRTGLETPLSGRLIGENKALIFAPPQWYEALMAVCLFGGLLAGILTSLGIMPLAFFQAAPWLGWAIMLAGAWAFLSSDRLIVNLKTQTWVRQEGGLLRFRVGRGSVSELDALVVVVENAALMGVATGASGVFRVVLHWKGQRQPPLVLDRLDAQVPAGMPAGQAAGPLFSKASFYGKILGLPVYDNTQQYSGAPLRPF